MRTQEDYTDALEQVDRIAKGLSSEAFSLRVNDDFMFFGDVSMEVHVARIATAREQAERLVRLLVRVEAYAEVEVTEAKKTSSAERQAALEG